MYRYPERLRTAWFVGRSRDRADAPIEPTCLASGSDMNRLDLAAQLRARRAGNQQLAFVQKLNNNMRTFHDYNG